MTTFYFKSQYGGQPIKREIMTLDDITLDDIEPTPKGTAVPKGVPTIKQHLINAKNNGVQFPRIKLGGFIFTLAPLTSRNPGAVYVKDSTKTYLGKIVDNQFHSAIYGAVTSQGLSTIEAIKKILENPTEAAIVHGQKTGMCCICGRTLTNGDSIAAMIGPICAGRYGF